MRKVNISISSKHSSARAFIKCLVVLIMEVNDNDTKKYMQSFHQWVGDAAEFLTTFGVKREFMTLANKYMIERQVFSKELGADLGLLVKDIQRDVNADSSISKFEYDFIRNCAASLHSNRDSAWNFLLRNVSKLGEPELTSDWVEDGDVEDLVTPDASAAAKGIKKIVLDFTGDASSLFMTMPKEQRLRKEDPKKAILYFQYKKVLLTIFKRSLIQYLRTSKKQMMPIDDVRSYMEAHHIANNLPRGFAGGQIDEFGAFYTREGKLLDKVISGPVVMNPRYDPATDNTYVLKSADPEWRIELRTITRGSAATKAKFTAVQKFIEEEPTLRTKWELDVKKDGTKVQVLAAMTDILYRAAARIGGNDPRHPTGNMGLSTVKLENLTISGNTATFIYSGKKYTTQKHVYKATDATSKKVLQVLKELIVGKKKTDLVFTYGNSPMLRQYVNKYLKSIGLPEGFTSHRFRHVLGTKLFMQATSKSPFKKEDHPTAALVNKWVATELEKIGARLHHHVGDKVTGSTAKNSYLDKDVLRKFYTDLGLRAPVLGKDDD